MTASGTARDYEEFTRSTRASMVARAAMMCGSVPDAEDAVQEAFLEAYRRWDRLAGYDSVEAWIHKVMAQRLWKARHRDRRQVTALSDLVSDLPNPRQSSPAEIAEVREVFDALDDLPRSQRIIVLLHCVLGYPQDEVAELLDVRRGTVGASLFRARHSLRRLFAVEPDSVPLDHDRFLDALPAGPLAALATPLRAAERYLRAALAGARPAGWTELGGG